MPVEKRETGRGPAKQTRYAFDKVHVSLVAFHKGVKVHDIELADFERLERRDVVVVVVVGTDNGRVVGLGEDVLPAPLEDVHARTLVPAVVPHPPHAGRVGFDDDVFSGVGILEIAVDLLRAV